MERMTDKRTVAQALDEIFRYMEIGDQNRFKAVAYRNAARQVENIEGDLGEFISSGALTRTPGIGKSIGPLIVEIAETGRSRYLDELRQQYPPGIFDLVRVPALGLKKIGVLHDTLGISSLDELETACRENRLTSLPGFGAKTQQKILDGIDALRKDIRKFLLPIGLELAAELVGQLRRIEDVGRVEVAGSVRRRLEVIRNVNIVLETTKKAAVIREIERIPAFANVSEGGPDIVRGELRNHMPVEIILSTPASFASNLLYATGSEIFITSLAAHATSTGFELSAEGLRQKRKIATRTEEEIFRKLDLAVIEPELREGDLTLAEQFSGTLLREGSLRGTFHVHSTWSDGKATLYEMLDAARDREFSYVGMSDHSKTASYAGGLTEERVREQQAEIDKLQKTFAPMRIFKGTEADILTDGSMDYDNETLATFDFVIASIHSKFKMPQDEMTERIIRAIRNPYVTFLGHLTGRLLLSRPGYTVDYEALFAAAADEGVMIEINGNPHRLELDWRLMQRAKEHGVRFSIHPDAHSTDSLDNVISGTWAARKGGLGPEDVFNTLPVEDVERYFAARKSRAKRMTSGS